MAYPSHPYVIVHHIPGRIRLRVAGAQRNGGSLENIRRLMANIDGVGEVSVRPLTGSVVVHYDRDDPGCKRRLEDLLMRAAPGFASPRPAHAGNGSVPKQKVNDTVREEASLVASALPESSETQVATEVVAADAQKLASSSPFMAHLVDNFKQADRAVKHRTRNVLNLQLLLILPFGLHSLFFRKKDFFFWTLVGLFSVHAFINLAYPDRAPLR